MPLPFILLLILCCWSTPVLSQQSASGSGSLPNQYIEGAKLVIDILQLFKKDNSRRSSLSASSRGGLCNFCIMNSDSLQKIKVVLSARSQTGVDAHTLVIKPGQQECSLQIPCGIYNCRVESVDEKVISWGDIHINEKEVFIKK